MNTTMSTIGPSQLRRHLRRVTSHIRATQRRQRATLVAMEDLNKSQQGATDHAPATLGKIGKTKSYEELPTPRGYPILGTLPQMLAAGGTQHYHKYVSERHRQLGGIFRETLGGNEMVFVSDPAAIRQVFAAEGPHPRHFIPEAWLLYNQDRCVTRGLFFMEGEEWKTNRSVLNRRLLRAGAIAPHHAAFSRVADSLVDRWTSAFTGTPIPDLERELYRWAIESLGVMVLGERLGFLQSGEKGSGRAAGDMKEFIDAIHGIFKETSAMGTLPPTLAKFLKLPVWSRFTDSVDRALASGRHLVEEGVAASMTREGEREEPVTLLDHLLKEDRLDPATIVCLLTDLFLAAADTTTHTTIWSLYLLGQHPKQAQRARQEILAATGGSLNVESSHLAAMPYLKGVVKEALRLYPVAPFQTRALHQDTMLQGHRVPAGTMVILSVYTTGRDPTHFTTPNQFCPERWVRENSSDTVTPSGCPITSNKLHSHAFIPFGFGVRSCIGRRVAEMQLHLLLAKLLVQADLRTLNHVDMVLRMVGVTSEPVQLQLNPLTLTKDAAQQAQ